MKCLTSRIGGWVCQQISNVQRAQETVDLVTLTEKILNGKLHFLCGGISYECRIRVLNQIQI